MNTSVGFIPAPIASATMRTKELPAETCSSYRLLNECIPGQFNPREMQQFDSLVVGRRRVARHASLYRAQDKLGMLYVVRYGQFKLVGGDAMGEPRVVGFHLAGDLVGLDAVASGRHQFRVMALENSEVCEIPFNDITRMMTVEPAIQRQFLQQMSNALINEYCRSALLSRASLDERFAQFLVSLGGRYAHLGYSDKSFRLCMSRGDIGSYIGTTVESVSRLIARFNAHGAALIKGRVVEIIDRPYLDALAYGGDQVGRPGWPAGSNGRREAPASNTISVRTIDS